MWGDRSPHIFAARRALRNNNSVRINDYSVSSSTND